MVNLAPLGMIGTAFSYIAMSPLKHRLDLMAGGGDGPLRMAASGYKAMADGLRLAAEGSSGAMTNSEVSWRGEAGNKARAAFRRHADWLRQQSVVADQMAVVAEGGADAFAFADKGVPSLAELLANIARRAASASLVGAGPVIGPLAMASYQEAEAEWQMMRVRAGMVMSAYDMATSMLVAGIPESVPPPQITTGGAPSLSRDPGSHTNLINDGPTPPPPSAVDSIGPNSPVGPDSTGSPDVGQSTPDSVQTPSEVGQSPTDVVQSPSEAGQSVADQGMSELERAMQPFDQSASDFGGYNGEGHELLGQEHLLGTSPYSTTLAGMTGGMGSMVALGMVGGGLGSMSGAATGFRMPANWTPGTGTAFGAGTGTTTSAPVGNSAPRRGVSAPTARMRRRRKEEENDKPGKVFVPGEAYEVPVLERPPAIGVIEYDDDDQREDEAPEELLVGVLDRFDEETEPAITERPR
ncbi:PPE domain-containing protein [Nocardia donostiensis]|uniref:PPE domain-containing protein n=1 Tax=Nocardia donostiensis TaxID=1538463 RepID=A0A1V2TA36_9NOCA|nr:PPE domain-containing protein [Nocardia donostiensis]ONM46360.1 hypothetical protein B0T46_23550 [Nocardia donostiensis]OQS18677.1 hypothetical protein B0T44_18440 [Nocardia donostiensis]